MRAHQASRNSKQVLKGTWFGDSGGGLRILEALTQKVDDTGLELYLDVGVIEANRRVENIQSESNLGPRQTTPHSWEETKLNL